MKKEKIKNFLTDAFDNIALFLWMLIPITPMLAVSALMFLELTSVWFWVSCIIPVVLIAITRPHIGSCSQWENVYWMSIMTSIIMLVLRICGIFPLI